MRDVFDAISDPTRRRILLLVRSEERSVSEIAREFEVTLPAISQHLRVLRDAGLVERRKDGNTRYYRARPERLAAVVEWLGQLGIGKA